MLKKLLQKTFTPNSTKVNQPLMTADEVADLANQLQAYWADLTPSQRASELVLLGEQSSKFFGQGMEYEESRPYQEGDDLRHLDWRLMAKTGKAFTKQYHEERQAQWIILLDRRASMRFASKTRLKVTQGLRAAGWLAWFAQNNRIAIEALGIESSVIQTPVLEGAHSYSLVMQSLSKACPPNWNEAQPSLKEVIQKYKNTWPQGARVWILSDFNDLTEADKSWLVALNEFWQVHGLWIEDSLETNLPAKDDLHLQGSGPPYLLSADKQQAYNSWAKSQKHNKQKWLREAGVQLGEVTTQDELASLIQQLFRGSYAS